MTDDYITRKDYDDRHTTLLVNMTAIQTTLAVNQTQITQLTTDVKQLLISQAKNKNLWPIITTLTTILSAVIVYVLKNTIMPSLVLCGC